MELERISALCQKTASRIVLALVDGLGGLPDPKTGKTELETARTPNLDFLARKGACGLTDPVGVGITSGSAPGILALLGYDPLRYLIGRGALEAVGVDFDLQEGDVAARGNFCTVDSAGLISDRRAGRITTDNCVELCRLMSKIELGSGVQTFVLPVREHRFALVLRSPGLSDQLADSDPQNVGVAPNTVKALAPQAEATAELFNRFIAQGKRLLKAHHPANMFLLRGFSHRPHHPSLSKVYSLYPAAIAVYPMYRGLARLVGMKLLATGSTVEDEFKMLKEHFSEHDFFFVHIKKTDMAGEDGDFKLKVSAIEHVDEALPVVMDLHPDVLIVTGDHSTPATMKGHSWHPVPFLLYSKWCRGSDIEKCSERTFLRGELGRFPAHDAMALAMAHGLKLTKYGA
ncbi:MAG TPA: 2,3-bisphosphoglycerate-independent phosphoglycerate mutase [Dehalococcoidia bacterium]|nr:2,3-bisphosphoglycerate-independent phosphoglycerate mutase [Dehalococcoidia bacterium]